MRQLLSACGCFRPRGTEGQKDVELSAGQAAEARQAPTAADQHAQKQTPPDKLAKHSTDIVARAEDSIPAFSQATPSTSAADPAAAYAARSTSRKSSADATASRMDAMASTAGSDTDTAAQSKRSAPTQKQHVSFAQPTSGRSTSEDLTACSYSPASARPVKSANATPSAWGEENCQLCVVLAAKKAEHQRAAAQAVLSGNSSAASSSEQQVQLPPQMRADLHAAITVEKQRVKKLEAPTRPLAPRPVDDEERLKTIDVLGCLACSRDDPQRNILSSLAATLFEAPLSCLALMGADMMWCKSMMPDPFAFIPTHNFVFPRGIGIIDWVLLPECKQALVLDQTPDIRFRDDAMAKLLQHGASVPLIASNGQRIGALCTCNKQMLKFTARHYAMLIHLAELSVRELERDAIVQPGASGHAQLAEDAFKAMQSQGISTDRQKPDLSRDYHKLEALGPLRARPLSALQQGAVLCDASKPGWPVVYVSTQFMRLLGLPAASVVGRGLWEVFEDPGRSAAESLAHTQKQAAHEGWPFTIKAREPMTNHNILGTVHCASVVGMGTNFPLVGVPAAHAVQAEPGADVPTFYTIMVSLDDNVDDSVPLHLGSGRSLTSSLEYCKMTRLFTDVTLRMLLGKGSYGSVFRATWRSLDVAVKVVEWQQAQNDAPEETAFVSEASLAVSLNHPNIVRTFEFAMRHRKNIINRLAGGREGETGTREPVRPPSMDCEHAPKLIEAWILMELCSKGSLLAFAGDAVALLPLHAEYAGGMFLEKSLLHQLQGLPEDANQRGWLRPASALRSEQPGPPNMAAVLATALDIAQGLAYMHSKGILHRDLTAGNVLLVDEPTDPRGFVAKVGDFGMSRFQEAIAVNTTTYGTVTHMPPELLMEGKLTKAADVWAFGILLWSMYTGEVPWKSLTRAQVMLEIAVTRKMLQLPADAPADYRELMMSCLSLDLEARPTFADLVSKLQDMLAGQQQRDSPASSEPVLAALAESELLPLTSMDSTHRAA